MSLSKSAQEAIKHVLAEEGGYVDHPSDPGGATNRGITLKTLEQWRGQPVTKDDVRNLTEAEATEIYAKRYWGPIRGDALPAPVAFVVMDCAVNSGVKRASQWLQQSVGVQADGVIGPKTIEACKAADPYHVVRTICATRIAFLKGLATFEHFGRGWTSRVNRVQQHALEMEV